MSTKNNKNYKICYIYTTKTICRVVGTPSISIKKKMFPQFSLEFIYDVTITFPCRLILHKGADKRSKIVEANKEFWLFADTVEMRSSLNLILNMSFLMIAGSQSIDKLNRVRTSFRQI